MLCKTDITAQIATQITKKMNIDTIIVMWDHSKKSVYWNSDAQFLKQLTIQALSFRLSFL